MKLTICHLYPDICNLYGDQGNVRTLIKRSEERGIETQLIQLPVGEKYPLSKCDLLFMGGGQEKEILSLQGEMTSWRGTELKAAIEDGKTLLAICGAYQLLGHSYENVEGETFGFMGALDFHTVAQKERMVGDYLFSWEETGENVSIVAFENHSGQTFLGDKVKPLGKVIKGYGNNGQDQTEGARYHNVCCTYGHGPILPKNPKFADFLLETALVQKYGSAQLEPLDDTLEDRANAYMVKRLSSQ